MILWYGAILYEKAELEALQIRVLTSSGYYPSQGLALQAALQQGRERFPGFKVAGFDFQGRNEITLAQVEAYERKKLKEAQRMRLRWIENRGNPEFRKARNEQSARWKRIKRKSDPAWAQAENAKSASRRKASRAGLNDDAYIRRLLVKDNALKPDEIPTELVELHRSKLKLHRELKQHNYEKHNGLD